MLDDALNYAGKGIPVFPLRGKKPLTSRGLLDATRDPEQIREWWSRWPDANIGGRMGVESGLVCADIDPRNGGHLSWEELQATYGATPHTWNVLTGGGGQHVYFAHPGEIARVPCSSGKVGPGIDIKGDGGYVVLPPSIHPETGKKYEWELSSGMDTPIAPMPQWLRAKAVESPAEKMMPKPIPKTIEDGQRHDVLTSLAGTLRRRDLDAEEIEEVLQIHNAKRCKTPLGSDEVRTIARSVAGLYGSTAPARPADGGGAPAGGEAGSGGGGGGPGDLAPGANQEGRRSSELKGPALHGALEEDIPRWLQKLGVQVNAIGDWVHTANGRIAGVHARILATEYANHFRRARQFVSVGYIQEVLEEHERARMKSAREALAAKVLALRGGTDDTLIDWVIAVTGEASALNIAVVKHWLWMVKRSLAKLPVEHHLMPILIGDQGSGKSTAAKLLCAPLKELACVPADGEMLTDKRMAPLLGRYVVGLWDEMEGADKASIEAVKRTITSQRTTYRPMATNSSATVDVTMQWIGASNRRMAAMFKDVTGNRRFIEIETLPRINWNAINAIEYEKLWACVDETMAPPIRGVLESLAEAQRDAMYEDSVAAWLSDENWGEWSDSEGLRYGGRLILEAIPAREMQFRYFGYCTRNNEKHTLSSSQLGVRLREMGWGRKRLAAGPQRTYAYTAPLNYRKLKEIA